MDFFGNQQEISVGTIDSIRCHGSKTRKYDRDSISFIPKRFNAQEMGHHCMQLALTWRLEMSLKMDENDVSLLAYLPTTFTCQRYQAPPTSPQSMANPSPRHGLALGFLGRHERWRNICQLGKFQTFRDPEIQNDHKYIPNLLKVKDLVVFNTKDTGDCEGSAKSCTETSTR